MVISYDIVTLQNENIKLQEENEELKQKIRDLQEKNRLLRDENVNEINRVDEFIANMKSMNVFQFVEFVNKYEEDMSNQRKDR